MEPRFYQRAPPPSRSCPGDSCLFERKQKAVKVHRMDLHCALVARYFTKTACRLTLVTRRRFQCRRESQSAPALPAGQEADTAAPSMQPSWSRRGRSNGSTRRTGRREEGADGGPKPWLAGYLAGGVENVAGGGVELVKRQGRRCSM